MKVGLDWPGLMRAGMTGLKLRPDEFWNLTPIELKLLLGEQARAIAMDRTGLSNLMSDYPDDVPAPISEAEPNPEPPTDAAPVIAPN